MTTCQCCVCVGNSSRSPLPLYATARPPFIYGPPTSRPSGREHCCNSVLISSGSRRTISVQHEKFGVYRLHRTDSSDGRLVFKHCDRDVFLYFLRTPTWTGWLAGPEVGVSKGGLILQTDSACVEDDLSSRWSFFDDDHHFHVDDTITVTCFSDDDHGRDSNPHVVVPPPVGPASPVGRYDKVHLHVHDHHHHHGEGEGRAISEGRNGAPGPAYKIESNPDFVEATFVFPNRKDTASASSTSVSSSASVSSVSVLDLVPDAVVIDAKTPSRSKDGIVAKRNVEQKEKDVEKVA